MGRAALVATAAWAASPPRGWPAFLPSPDGFPADVVAAVERTWTDRTLSRTVRGPSVRAPFDLYSALIDAPDVTAAAARYRNFSRGTRSARSWDRREILRDADIAPAQRATGTPGLG